MTGLQKEFYQLAEGYATRDGFAALAWEAYKRLSPKKRRELAETMLDESDDEGFIERLAELLR